MPRKKGSKNQKKSEQVTEEGVPGGTIGKAEMPSAYQATWRPSRPVTTVSISARGIEIRTVED